LIDNSGCMKPSPFLRDGANLYRFGGDSSYAKNSVFRDTLRTRRPVCIKEAVQHSSNTFFAVAGARIVKGNPDDGETQICMDRYGYTVDCICTQSNERCEIIGAFSPLIEMSPFRIMEHLVGLNLYSFRFYGDLSDELNRYLAPAHRGTLPTYTVYDMWENLTPEVRYFLDFLQPPGGNKRLMNAWESFNLRAFIQLLYGTGELKMTPMFLKTVYLSLLNYPSPVRPRLLKGLDIEGTVNKVRQTKQLDRSIEMMSFVREGMEGLSFFSNPRFNRNRFVYAGKTGTDATEVVIAAQPDRSNQGRALEPHMIRLRDIIGDKKFRKYFAKDFDGRFIVFPNKERFNGQYNSIDRQEIPFVVFSEAVESGYGATFAARNAMKFIQLVEGTLQ
jgi:cell division protein FtsI/penicillin-binding protein 2